MENAEHFGTLTKRMKEFREEVLDEKPYIDAERAILATEAYKENLNQPRVMVRAKMLEKILDHMSIYIEDKSLLAGNQATKNRNAPIFPEYTMEFVINELDQFEKRDGDVFYITEKTKEQLREIAPFWENNNLRARGEALLPEEVRVFMETGVFGMEGMSGVGISFGADRIYDVLNQLDLYPKEAVNGTQLLFVNFGEAEAAYVLPVLMQAREAGIRAEIYPDSAKMKKQMGYANSKNIPFVALVGETEMNEGKVTLKNMTTGEQTLVTPEELIAAIRK